VLENPCPEITSVFFTVSLPHYFMGNPKSNGFSILEKIEFMITVEVDGSNVEVIIA
jgi:hypothetical protein